MMTRFILCAILCGVCFGQRDFENSDTDCPSQWLSFSQCLQEQQRFELEKAGLSRPNDEEKRNLDSDVQQCFRRFDCRDPITSEEENRARLDCFRKSQQKLRSELQECVKREISDFSLPEDNFGSGDTWSIYLKQLNNAVKNYQTYCQKRINQRDLRVCVEQALSDFVKRRQPESSSGSGQRGFLSQRKTRNYCEMRAQCMSINNNNNFQSHTQMTESCDNEWRRRAVPQLCSCGQDLRNQGRVRTYEGDFLACMNAKKIRVNTTNDPAFAWLDGGLDVWCSRKNRPDADPCSTVGGQRFTPQPNRQSTQSTTEQGGWFWLRSTTSAPNWNSGGDGNGEFGPSNWGPNTFTNQPQGGDGGGFFGRPQPQPQPPPPPPPSNGFGGLGNLFGGNGGGFGGLFGGGNTGLGQSGNGDLFGGLLNNLGIGNPFDAGTILGSFAELAQVFQNILGGFGG